MFPLALLAIVGVSLLPSAQGACNRVVCYHTNWSQYRNGDGKFFPDNIDPSLCTHMIYAFAKLTGDHLAPFEWNDDSTDWSTGLYEKFNNLKQRNPAVKTLLAVGGWNLGSSPFHNIAISASHRQEFVTQAIKFLRERGFDGLDLDWEYPANRGSPAEDRHHFTELVHELRVGFEQEAQTSGKPALMLTAAVAAGKDKIDTAYEVPEIAKDLDFISLMSYDLHGSWETVTGHNSPLYAGSWETGDDKYLNIDWAARYWVQKGCPAEKLNVGMGLYGRSFTLNSASNNGMGAPASKAGTAGQFTREAGFISYYEVCDMIKRGGTVEFNNEQRVPFVHNGNQWVGYDSPDSLREKVRYVKQNNFGGVMVWALPLDDFSGNHCGEGPFPLMHAINDECNASGGPQVTSAPTNAPPATTQPPAMTTQSSGGQQTTQSAQGSQTTQDSGSHNINHDNNFNCGGRSDGFYANPRSCSEYYICAGGAAYAVDCANGLVFNADTGFCDFPEHYSRCNVGHVSPSTAGPTSAAQQTTAQAAWQTNAPATNAPATNAPVTNAPWTSAAATNGPVTNPPATNPPATNAPITNAPVTNAPVTNAPVTNAPATSAPGGGSVDVNLFCRSHSDGIHADPTDCTYFIECANGSTFREKCAPGTGWRDDIHTCDRVENIPGCTSG